jgi:hypothetical protein
MKSNVLFISCILLFLFGKMNASCAQVNTFQPKGSFTLNIGIPTSERNVAFRIIMEGLLKGGLGYQYNIYKGLTIGGGAKYSFFINNQFALNKTAGRGSLHIPALYLKVAYEKFTSDRFLFNFGVNFGYANFLAVNDSTKSVLGKAYQESSFFIQPELEFLMNTKKNSPNGFSLIFGYDYYFTNYGPRFLARKDFADLPQKDSAGLISFFNFALGYRYFFGVK